MTTDIHKIIRENAGQELEPLEASEQAKLVESSIAIRYDMKIEWQQQEITKDFFADISAQIDECEERARQLACNYHQNNNHQEIIYLLVRASELRKLKKNYGTGRNNSVNW